MIESVKRWVASHRILVTLPAAVLLFVLAAPTRASVLAGLAFIMAGESIRVWASGTIEKNKVLATGGPYRFTRNPLYLGNFFLGLGFAAMSGQVLIVGIYPVLFYLVYDSVIRDEERRLMEKFGPLFEEMRRSVPRFFPARPRVSGTRGAGHFSWLLVWKHREPVTWAGLAAATGLMILRGWVSW